MAEEEREQERRRRRAENEALRAERVRSRAEQTDRDAARMPEVEVEHGGRGRGADEFASRGNLPGVAEMFTGGGSSVGPRAVFPGRGERVADRLSSVAAGGRSAPAVVQRNAPAPAAPAATSTSAPPRSGASLPGGPATQAFSLGTSLALGASPLTAGIGPVAGAFLHALLGPDNDPEAFAREANLRFDQAERLAASDPTTFSGGRGIGPQEAHALAVRRALARALDRTAGVQAAAAGGGGDFTHLLNPRLSSSVSGFRELPREGGLVPVVLPGAFEDIVPAPPVRRERQGR